MQQGIKIWAAYATSSIVGLLFLPCSFHGNTFTITIYYLQKYDFR